MSAALRPGLAVLGLALAAACAGPSEAPPVAAAVPAAPAAVPAAAAAPATAAAPPPPEADEAPVPASAPAARLARALIEAERAERAGDRAALARAAMRLGRLGPVPATPDDGAALARWLAAMPEDAAPMRGRALGPAFRSGTLLPGTSTRLEQTFLGGRAAQIVLRVAAGSDLALVVRDQARRRVCHARKDPIECRWTPLYTQRHQIEIVNEGADLSRFYIVFD
ncbi:hypothetical protein [Erythrobacter sp. HL-111]|uniref:hypothetical protein n=1 Tax=Erythrobacter sp. HL-111 TaxID=1798193 RepID=UPI0006DBCEC8|nr:hypothetical protein [Erythrobacter sp. HL-111]KPP92909.1 MAG: hypothetical protein HLUCCO15_07110 [Erythrobacteraceae bacterium HL-111]SDT01314.1 hypothetical protein SAMN04515621_2716 [Erythrobacter sp. HL-111]